MRQKRKEQAATENKDVIKTRANDKHFIRERPKLPSSSLRSQPVDEEDDIEVQPQHRGLRVNYAEDDVPDDDHFLCE